MADDVLEQKVGGTFAEDLGVEPEYAQVEDLSAEQFNTYVECAAEELNPNLGEQDGELVYEEEPSEYEDAVGFEEYLALLGNVANEQSRGISHLAEKVEGMVTKIDRIQKVMEKIVDAVTGLVENRESNNSDLLDHFEEEYLEPEDLDAYTPKKRGSPGRPAKEATKIPLPPKKEKSKKAVVKKKKPVVKKVVKKKAPAKKKAAKKKSKR